MKAEVFTQPGCPYCVAAKQLLVKKGVSFVERDISHPENRAEVQRRAPGTRTMPQVFLDGRLIGGFDDLARHFSRASSR